MTVRRAMIVASLALVALGACSGGDGGPTAMDQPSVFALGARVSLGVEGGILEVTALLDGREIARSFSSPSEGETVAILNGTEIGTGPGRHAVELHFERVVPSPAEVTIVIGGTYVPPNGSEERIVLQDFDRTEEVRPGDLVRFEFDV